MVARTRCEPERLAVIFERDGEPPEQKVAVGGEQAALFAIGLVIARAKLLAGDKVTVTAVGDEE